MRASSSWTFHSFSPLVLPSNTCRWSFVLVLCLFVCVFCLCFVCGFLVLFCVFRFCFPPQCEDQIGWNQFRAGGSHLFGNASRRVRDAWQLDGNTMSLREHLRGSESGNL